VSQAPAKRVVAVGQRHPELREAEDRLVEIWGRLLDLEEIDVHRSFHELGGDSLLATKLFREIDRVWPNRIDIADIFTDASIHQMAKRVQAELCPPAPESAAPDADAELDLILSRLASGELRAEEVSRSAELGSEGN
jgi:polyketide synthase PksN